MLNALQEDKDVLYYNIFGIVEINKDEVRVTANLIRLGMLKPAVLRIEPKTEIKNFSKPFIVSFGAWLDNDDVHVGIGQMDEYEKEVFQSNREIISNAIRDGAGLLKGALV